MGFGTLFVAFLLLFNFVYVAYTDLICALLMTLAFVKLTPIRREFRAASYISLAFALLGIGELIYEIYQTYRVLPNMLAYLSMARCVLLCTLTVLTLLGIRKTAREVGLGRLAVRCESLLIVPMLVYTAQLVLDIPHLFDTVDGVAVFASVLLLLEFVMHVVIAVTIYKAYARICMPDDVDMNAKKPPSRFAFINAMRRHEEEKQAAQQRAAQAAFEERMRRKKTKKK